MEYDGRCYRNMMTVVLSEYTYRNMTAVVYCRDAVDVI